METEGGWSEKHRLAEYRQYAQASEDALLLNYCEGNAELAAEVRKTIPRNKSPHGLQPSEIRLAGKSIVGGCYVENRRGLMLKRLHPPSINVRNESASTGFIAWPTLRGELDRCCQGQGFPPLLFDTPPITTIHIQPSTRP